MTDWASDVQGSRFTVARIGQVQGARKRKSRMRHGTINGGARHGRLHGRACTSGNQNETAGVGNLAKSVSGVRDHHALPGIFLSMPQNGASGFWNHHNPLYAKEGLSGIEVAENVFAGV